MKMYVYVSFQCDDIPIFNEAYSFMLLLIHFKPLMWLTFLLAKLEYVIEIVLTLCVSI